MNEQQYREHWATLTGRPVREVYVPLALREVEPSLESVQEMLDRVGEIKDQLGIGCNCGREGHWDDCPSFVAGLRED